MTTTKPVKRSKFICSIVHAFYHHRNVRPNEWSLNDAVLICVFYPIILACYGLSLLSPLALYFLSLALASYLITDLGLAEYHILPAWINLAFASWVYFYGIDLHLTIISFHIETLFTVPIIIMSILTIIRRAHNCIAWFLIRRYDIPSRTF